MPRPTTPTPATGDTAPPRTPAAAATVSSNAEMRVQRNAPAPSTPHKHRRKTSYPQTPHSVQNCSASGTDFMVVRVHTAKCSECDLRNKGTMLRCPGCTFQVCGPCREGRERGGRSLAHGNMRTPGTPWTGGRSVVRRRVGGMMGSGGGEKGVVVEGHEKVEDGKGAKRVLKPAAKPRTKGKGRARDVTPSDDSSDDDFASDLASPSANKRRRTGVIGSGVGATDGVLKASDGCIDSPQASAKAIPGDSTITIKSLSDMTTAELLAHHGVNTPANPYKLHLLSRQEPVVSSPVIEMPEVVKRGFKPRPTAEDMQKNIQEKVRKKMGLPALTGGAYGSG